MKHSKQLDEEKAIIANHLNTTYSWNAWKDLIDSNFGDLGSNNLSGSENSDESEGSDDSDSSEDYDNNSDNDTNPDNEPGNNIDSDIDHSERPVAGPVAKPKTRRRGASRRQRKEIGFKIRILDMYWDIY
eukprot:TRINITY_DN2355_c0_g2_i1.p1 TRINITY_DN2355_c0_g2~~TRINITY_DN2355_c0_g2_i1.p1  ORF type:complete len:130 (-),score=24.50 TRINITY_DN2355_c0_g2_i1:758-1147(-)